MSDAGDADRRCGARSRRSCRRHRRIPRSERGDSRLARGWSCESWVPRSTRGGSFRWSDHVLRHAVVVGPKGPLSGGLSAPSGGRCPCGPWLRLYVAHGAIIPGLILGLCAVHAALIKRHGIAPSPSAAQREVAREPREPFTHHLRRLGALTLVLLGALGVLGGRTIGAALPARLQPRASRGVRADPRTLARRGRAGPRVVHRRPSRVRAGDDLHPLNVGDGRSRQYEPPGGAFTTPAELARSIKLPHAPPSARALPPRPLPPTARPSAVWRAPGAVGRRSGAAGWSW